MSFSAILDVLQRAQRENRSQPNQQDLNQLIKGIDTDLNSLGKPVPPEQLTNHYQYESEHAKGDLPINPEWLYTHWNWNAWPLQAQNYWINKWKHSNPTDKRALYKLLYENERNSIWWMINNFISHHNDTGSYGYSCIPDPDGELEKFEPARVNYFYETLVPYAGAFVTWFKQINSDLIYGPDLTGYRFKVYTQAPSAWFCQTGKVISNTLGGAGGIGFLSGGAVVLAVGVGAFILYERSK